MRGVSEKFEPFVLEAIRFENGHLTATASYKDFREPGESKLPATIDGVQAPDCTFWPHVTMQVSNQLMGSWISVDSPKKTGKPARVTLERNSPNVWLHLQFDAFQAMIGKFKYGRLTLTNGKSAVFEIRNLLPPAGPPPAWETTITLPEGDPFNTLPFAVAGIESMGDDLRAVCEYLDMKGTAPTLIEGTQTPDGAFWPLVIGQVANEHTGEWKTIGQLPSAGRPATLSVQPRDINVRLLADLEVFRPMIGRYRYGRIVLRNGKAAPFELKNLLPPEEGARSEHPRPRDR
jgi:hypothetical protein